MMENNRPNTMGFWLTMFAFLTVLVGFLLYSGGYLQAGGNIKITQNNGHNMVILHASDGQHYRINGKINNVSVRFLLDTGATGIAVNEHIARKAGMPQGTETTVSTANGDTRAYYSKIEYLRFAGIEISNLHALVMPNMDDEVLLGMSVLRQFNWRQENGELILSIPDKLQSK